MATITEDYVSFEIAKLLKDKGFDEDCWYWYEEDGYLRESNDDFGFQSNSWHVVVDDEFSCSAPTLQMAMKWLREVHKIFIEVYAERAYNYNDIIFNLEIWDRNLNLIWKDGSFTTYEQACEAALKYSLENLIK